MKGCSTSHICKRLQPLLPVAWTCLLFFLVLTVSPYASAWGPFTHAYIAIQIFPDAPPKALFGAMAADMNAFASEPVIDSSFKRLTHNKADLLSPTLFRLGLLTHNAEWGADSYAHAYFNDPSEKPYPYRIFNQLSHEMAISINDAEDIIEAVMDFVICRDLGIKFTKSISDAIAVVGEDEEQALVEAYTAPLCHQIEGLSSSQGKRSIRNMFRCDKASLKYLAIFMALPETLLLKIGPYLLAPSLHMEPEKMDLCVKRGIELCADWRTNLDSISEEIASEMHALHLL
jgi:hypothetical protein